jgi:transglutaminase-like putative cysteine protease
MDCDSAPVKERARDLTAGKESVEEKAKSLFYFVRDEIRYNPYSQFYLLEAYRASATLSRGDGYCVQKAVLLAALARAAAIPARLRFADIRNYIVPGKLAGLLKSDSFPYHGYDELYIGGRWVKATPAFDRKMCEKNRVIPVEFDGRNDATFHSHNRDGKLHIEYVLDRGPYDDVPLDEIMDAWARAYGAETVERFKLTWGKAA